MKKFLGTISSWFFGLVFVFAGVNINEPYLISMRGFGTAAILMASVSVFIFLIKLGYWNRRGVANKLLNVLWCLPSLSMRYAHALLETRKDNGLQTDIVGAHTLGQHFIVGYSSFQEIVPLAERGLITGIYIARHNIARGRADALKSEISALQDRRRSVGLPPLIVAADQEGGIVSHLSPPLTALPSLSMLADLRPSIRAKKAEEFGRIHGQELSAWHQSRSCTGTGPAARWRPQPVRLPYSHQSARDIRRPAAVADNWSGLCAWPGRVQCRCDCEAFPRIGRVRGDMHPFSAALDTPLAVLEASDWRPFRDVLASSKAQLMIGHVILTAVDPDRPASQLPRCDHCRRPGDGRDL